MIGAGCAGTAGLATLLAAAILAPPLTADQEPGDLAARIEGAVRDLGSPTYAVRERAMRQIAAFGPAAGPALRRAARTGSPEVVQRARYFLEQSPHPGWRLFRGYVDGPPARLAGSRRGTLRWVGLLGERRMQFGRTIESVALTEGCMATAGRDGTVRLWDLESGAERGEFHAGGSEPALATSGDSRWLATICAGELRVWNGLTGREHPTFGARKQVRNVAFGPQGRWLVAGGADGTLTRWEIGTGQVRWAIRIHPDRVTGPVAAVAVDSRGTRLVAATYSEITVRDPASGSVLSTIPGREQSIRALAVTPDGRRGLAFHGNGAILVYDLQTGAVLTRLETERLRWEVGRGRVALSPDGRRLAAVEYQGRRLRIWDTSSWSLAREIPGGGHEVAWSHDGRALVCVRRGQVTVWDTASWTERPYGARLAGRTNRLALTPDGSRLLAAHDRGDAPEARTLVLWDPRSGAVVGPEWPERLDVRAAAAGPDGRWFVMGAREALLRLDLATGKVEETRRETGSCEAVAVSPDGRRILCALYRTLALQDVADAQEPRTWEGSGHPVRCLAWDPRGRWFASGGADRLIHLWSGPGARLRVLSAHRHHVLGLAASPDGSQLASASADRTLKLWEVDTGTEARTLAAHEAAVRAVAWSADGQWLLSAGEDGTVRLWDALSGLEADTLDLDGTPRDLLLAGHDLWVGMEDGNIHQYRFTPSPEGLVAKLRQERREWRGVGPDERLRARFAGLPPPALLASPAGRMRWTGLLGDGRLRHGARVVGLVWSPDGSQLATAAEGEHWVKIQEAATGREVRTIVAPEAHEVTGLDWTPDGALILTSGMDDTLRVWKAADRSPVRQLGRPNPYRPGDPLSRWNLTWLTAVATSRDGQWIAAGGSQGEVTLWRTGEDAPIRRFLAGDVFRPVWRLDFSRDGRFLVADARGGGGGLLGVYEASTGRLVRHDLAEEALHETLGHLRQGRRCAVDPTGRRRASAREPLPRPIADSERELERVAFSPDGRWIAGAGELGGVWVWDAETGRERRPPEVGHVGAVRAVVAGPDGRWIASGGDDGTVRVWDATSGRERLVRHQDEVWEASRLSDWRGRASPVTAMALTPDGRRLLTAGGNLFSWDASSWGFERAAWARERFLALGPDGQWFVTVDFRAGYEDSWLRVWDRPGLTVRRQWKPHRYGAGGVAVSPDGRWIASRGSRTVKLWDARSGELVHAFQDAGGWQSSRSQYRTPLAFSPDGRYCAAAAEGGLVHLLDLRSRKSAARLEATPEVTALAFSSCGTRLFAASGTVLSVWDPRSGALEDRIRVDGHPAYLAVQGRRVWLGCEDATLRLYEHALPR